jgi:hypothetical protein
MKTFQFDQLSTCSIALWFLILCCLQGYYIIALLQIPLNIKFKLLFLISSPLENESNPSSTQPIIVSFANISPSQVASNSVREDFSNQIPPKKWKLYESSRKF